VRVGVVSPYSCTYPGGVGRHAESLARELLRAGHEVRVLAPCDPDDRLARIAHRGARPERRELPDYVVPLGRTIGLPANGAVSNLAMSTEVAARLRRELRTGRFDVVHVHEPNAPLVSWIAPEAARAPVVGTFHTYSTNRFAHGAATLLGARRIYNRLSVRIAVSEAARWTAERYYGGRYRLIPNGVDLSSAPTGPRQPADHLRLLFVGRAEERKGLPVLLRAFEALRSAGLPARLTVAGATPAEVEPLLLDAEGVEVAGRVSEEEKWRLLHEADVLCAPSLGGESFGMVLTEAFACGTPVVCSDIAGYRDVVRDRSDALLVTPGDPAELGHALHELASDHDMRERLGTAARQRAERFAWPRVAEEVVSAYEDAVAAPTPAGRMARAGVRAGLVPADLGPRRPPRRMPPLDRATPRQAPGAARRPRRGLRRGAMVAGAIAGASLGTLALERIGLDPILASLVAATPVWVLVAFALMCASMLVRAEAWHAVLQAALPGVRVRRRDTARGTMIGVLMSATLPARLGEPSRALIVARRVGRVRERLPVVLGSVMSQTILNAVALVILGSVMFATVGLFRGNEDALLVVALAPAVMLAVVLAVPFLLRRGKPSRFVRVRQAAAVVRRGVVQARTGLKVFRNPRLGTWAALTQLSAWVIQWLACYALLVALGLDERAGIGAAAAVLFAVNVTAVLPATPSNLGVFQAACVAVLSAYGIGEADAFAYGIILQAVEIATAVAMGMPALLREGMTWKDMRVRALHATPVQLAVGSRSRDPAEAEA
jgi:phosphatidyl-myo-inositol alpha-mannosyltransferase